MVVLYNEEFSTKCDTELSCNFYLIEVASILSRAPFNVKRILIKKSVEYLGKTKIEVLSREIKIIKWRNL